MTVVTSPMIFSLGTVEIVDGTLQVGGATVTTFDIQTTNGIIHVIDAVITESAP